MAISGFCSLVTKGKSTWNFILRLSIVRKDSGAVYNIHIFAMYEGADSHQNMAKVLQNVLRDNEKMQSEKFSLCEHKVKVVLVGDYHFLDDCLGHQGSSATYPSAKHLVTLDHL